MRVIPIVLLIIAIGLLANGSYIHVKAQLAQWLISHAWLQSTDGNSQIKPWPWADTWPVAKLSVADHDIEQYVLAGVSGESLAFGPGYVFSSARPTERGNTIIAAHRDTHFTFLQEIQRGQIIKVQTREGRSRDYVVEELRIVDKTDVSWLEDSSALHQLTLVTCYPFYSLELGGRLRYVVRAVSLPQYQAESPVKLPA